MTDYYKPQPPAPVFGGVLQAKASVDLRDHFAACALIGLAIRPSVNIWTETDDVCDHAYNVADSMLRARALKPNEADRQARLAQIGELSVRDYLGTGDVQLNSADLESAIRQFVDAAKIAPTDPAPAPDRRKQRSQNRGKVSRT